ncbi:MAG TPA: hypothetical protein VN692_04095 [Steroidobacteraceae bacterium]|nr:hypothetical protein [Steroidobacteraceae bacterium]
MVADYSDLQVRSVNPVNDFLALSNAGSARIKGLEMEVSAKPISELQVGATASRLDAAHRIFLHQRRIFRSNESVSVRRALVQTVGWSLSLAIAAQLMVRHAFIGLGLW